MLFNVTRGYSEAESAQEGLGDSGNRKMLIVFCVIVMGLLALVFSKGSVSAGVVEEEDRDKEKKKRDPKRKGKAKRSGPSSRKLYEEDTEETAKLTVEDP